MKNQIPSIARRWASIVTLAVFLAVAPVTTRAASARSDGLLAEGLVGLGAAVCSLVYSPIKIVYAGGGVAISTLALLWTFGDTGVAGPIFSQTVGGDYVVTPAHMVGDRRLEFFGPR